MVAMLLALPASIASDGAASSATKAGKRVASQRVPGDVRFKADATRPSWAGEWADISCASHDRVKRVKAPVAQGKRAYRIRLQDGDESYGERCELGMANTPSADIDRVGGSRVLFHNGTDSWIAQQIMLDASTFSFCQTKCWLPRRWPRAAAEADGRVRYAGERDRRPRPAASRGRARAPQLGRERLRERVHEVAVEGADPPR